MVFAALLLVNFHCFQEKLISQLSLVKLDLNLSTLATRDFFIEKL